MKKTVFALASLIYLLLSSGMAFSVHYCMNERDSLKFGVTKTEICGRCGMEESESLGCCKDEHFLIKLTDDQQTVVSAPFPVPPQAEAIANNNYNPFLHPPVNPAGIIIVFSDISPPPLLTDRNILFSNFRI